jgi:hypothetical protein
VEVKLDLGIYWPLNILRSLCWMDIKLGKLVYPREEVAPFNLEIKKPNVRTSNFIPWYIFKSQ